MGISALQRCPKLRATLTLFDYFMTLNGHRVSSDARHLLMGSIMLKKILFSAFLVAGTSCLPAYAQLWNFQYTGFQRFEDGRDLGFQPDSFSGNFRGIDGNGNGVLDYSEVSRFTWDGAEYARNSLPHPGCPHDACKLNSFSFDLATHALQFSGDWNERSPVIGGATGTLRSGDHYETFFFTDIGHDTLWRWTDQTAFTISAIPEPSSIAMSTAGLLLLMRRLRKYGATRG